MLKPLQEVDPALAPFMPLLDEASIRIAEAARELRPLRRSAGPRQRAPGQRREAPGRHRGARAQAPRACRRSCRSVARTSTRSSPGSKPPNRTSPRCAASRVRRWPTYRELAARLSRPRAPPLRAPSARKSRVGMQALGMTGGRFQVDVSPHSSAEPQPHGLDQIEFRVTANPGQPLRPLAKVASGGELSRLSLAVQVACTADGRPLHGVRRSRCRHRWRRGRNRRPAAARAGQSRSQVFCVTHLPQVASQGHHHLRVREAHGRSRPRAPVLSSSARGAGAGTGTHAGWHAGHRQGTEHAREMLQAASAEPASESPRGRRPRQG